MKTKDLIGDDLDRMVAHALGHDLRPCGDGTHYNKTEEGTIGYTADGEERWEPSLNPAQGQPILQENEITTLAPNFDGEAEHWTGISGARLGVNSEIDGIVCTGPTMLIAGLRALVVKAFGETLELAHPVKLGSPA